jgi:hypothetical protein
MCCVCVCVCVDVCVFVRAHQFERTHVCFVRARAAADDDYGWYGPDVDNDDGGDDAGGGFEAAVPAGAGAADAGGLVAPLSFDEAVGTADAAGADGASYEALCRAHIERFMRGANAYAAESQLSRRVAAWQGRLEPLLAAEEARPAFDIRACGEAIVRACARACECE